MSTGRSAVKGTVFVTRTGYKIRVSVVSLSIIAEIRELHGVNDIRPFTYKGDPVEETGAVFEEEYTPPETPPTPEDGRAYEIYREYLAYEEDLAERHADYRTARTKYILSDAVEVMSYKGRKKSASARRKTGKWRTAVVAGGIEITPENEYPIFLKAEVLKDSNDFLRVIDLAIPEEVTLGDVEAAWDRFRRLLQQSTAFEGVQIPPDGWLDTNIAAAVGSEDGPGDGDTVGDVVDTTTTNTG